MTSRHLPTASGLPRAIPCPASAALPAIPSPPNEHQAAGNARHDFLADVPQIGAEAALARVPEEHREMCARIQLEGLPLHNLAAQEIAVGLDLATGKAREIGRRLNRKYGPRGLLEFIGTADSAFVTDEAVVVDDWKGAWADVGDLREHWQLRFLALAFAVLWGRKVAIIRRWRIMEDGSHVPSELFLDAKAMSETEAVLTIFIDAWLQACTLVAADKQPDVIPGPHCTDGGTCPAFKRCPAQVGLMAQMRAEPTQIRRLLPVVTEENAAECRAAYTTMKKLLGEFGQEIHHLGRHIGFPLGNGKFYGAHTVADTKVDAAVAWSVVKREHGVEIAEKAVTMKATQASVERAAQALVDAGKVKQMAPEKRRLLALIDEAGGLEVGVKVKVEEFKRSA
jgi:hypothetical protein